MLTLEEKARVVFDSLVNYCGRYAMQTNGACSTKFEHLCPVERSVLARVYEDVQANVLGLEDGEGMAADVDA